MNKYGLTKHDLRVAQEKIDMQRKYLETNELLTSNGQFKKLIDLSFSANHSVRYYAQLANKINTMENIAFNENLIPTFLTITLDGFYRELVRGDYNRFNSYTDDKRSDIFKSVPNNEKLGFVANKMRYNQKLTIKDLYNILNYQMQQFRKGVAFKDLKKASKTYIYIKTVEPHKDGVPHFHMLLFIPKDFISIFQKDFKRFFVAPQNSKPKRDKQRNIIKDSMTGFETDIKNASAYIMKYITKSFLDVKNNNKLDYLNAWFVKHRIMRCVTSRSVLPQWIYKIISIFEKDWGYLTDILSSKSLDNMNEWNQEQDYFYIYDNWSDREICYEYGRLRIYSKGFLVHEAGKQVFKPYTMTSYDKVPNTWSKKDSPPIPYFLDEKHVGFYNKHKFILNNNKTPQNMNDFELYKYYTSLDIKTVNLHHFGYIKNNMIDRGLLNGVKSSLNDYTLGMWKPLFVLNDIYLFDFKKYI